MEMNLPHTSTLEASPCPLHPSDEESRHQEEAVYNQEEQVLYHPMTFFVSSLVYPLLFDSKTCLRTLPQASVVVWPIQIRE
jgi:hypothetical protein